MVLLIVTNESLGSIMENFINIVFDTKQEVDDIVRPEVATPPKCPIRRRNRLRAL